MPKRILRVPDFAKPAAPDKKLYPTGIIGSIRELDEESPLTNRIELFAHRERGKKRYGIIRQLFTAVSWESRILNLANASSNVIEIHGMPKEGGERNEIIEGKLVLKRSERKEGEREQQRYTEHAPRLLVSRHWLDVMKLNSGDMVIISNPRESYEIPPPILSSK